MSPTRTGTAGVAGLRRGAGTTPAAEVPAETEPPAVPAPQLPPRPEKPVRFTLDLDREHHQFLKTYAVQVGADASKVMRALLDELREGPNLSARVQSRLWQR